MKNRLGDFLYLSGFLMTALSIYASYVPGTTMHFNFGGTYISIVYFAFAWPIGWILRWLITGKKSLFYTKSLP